jgi:N-formylglutamate deformylase
MTAHEFITIKPGTARLILSIPHAGTVIPDHLAGDYVSRWQAQADADWWLGELYDFAAAMDVTIVQTSISRSVIDVNRDPSGVSLYPGMATTGLCPTEDFDGRPLYKTGLAPDAAAIAERLDRYFQPYHAALAAEIARVRALHGDIVVFDAHSIRSNIPRLFDGTLPVCNIGTNDGVSATPALTDALAAHCAASRFSHIVNGRFKGGYITRHYGAPNHGVHAVQLELACRAYIDEPDGDITPHNWPTPYAATRASAVRALLHILFNTCIDQQISK